MLEIVVPAQSVHFPYQCYWCYHAVILLGGCHDCRLRTYILRLASSSNICFLLFLILLALRFFLLVQLFLLFLSQLFFASRLFSRALLLLCRLLRLVFCGLVLFQSVQSSLLLTAFLLFLCLLVLQDQH